MSHGRGAALHRSAHPIWTHMVPLRCTYGPPSYVTVFEVIIASAESSFSLVALSDAKSVINIFKIQL